MASAGAKAQASSALHRVGLLAAKQSRAQATGAALIATGRELLNSRDFDALTIAELAAANELSVGSFYGRFRDKEAYFAVLQEVVVAEMLEIAAVWLRPEAWVDRPLNEVVAALMQMVVGGFRANRGIIKASLKHASTQPQTWTPFKRCAADIADRVVALLVPRIAPARARIEARVRFVMQVAYGLLVNAVLNDPGPYRLDQDALHDELTALVLAYLGQGGTPSRGTRRRRGTDLETTPSHRKGGVP